MQFFCKFMPFTSMSAAEFAILIKKYPKLVNYKNETIIKLYSCSTGGKTWDGSLNFAQELANLTGLTVVAPIQDFEFVKTFSKPTYRVEHLDGGDWETFLPQK